MAIIGELAESMNTFKNHSLTLRVQGLWRYGILNKLNKTIDILFETLKVALLVASQMSYCVLGLVSIIS